MRQMLSRFAALVPEFGERTLDLDDLHHLCEAETIETVEIPMRQAHGFSWTDPGGDCIYINQLITPSQKIIAGWHERLHLACHPTDARVLASLGPLASKVRWEIEADAAGVIALIPRRDLCLSVGEIAARYRIARKVVEFRLQLFADYKV